MTQKKLFMLVLLSCTSFLSYADHYIIVSGYKPAENRKQVVAKISADLSKKTHYELTTQDFICQMSVWKEAETELLKPNTANKYFKVTLQSSTKMVPGAGNTHSYQLVKDKHTYNVSLKEPRGIVIKNIMVVTDAQ